MGPPRRRPSIAVAVGLFTVAVAVAVCGVGLDAGLLGRASPALAAFASVGALGLVVSRTRGRSARRRWRARGPRRYDRERELSGLSQGLASARTFDAVLAHTTRSFAATLGPECVFLFRRESDNAFRSVADATSSPVLRLPPALAERVAAGEILLCAPHAPDGGALPGAWGRIAIELLVPLPVGGPPVGLLGLGRRTSGRRFGDRDLRFLRTAGNQIAMAMTNSVAFEQLADLNQSLARLNESLEGQVEERTAALHAANGELTASVAMQRTAYRRLEQTQASLLRTERLATLGRLISGLAHEMNTPLGAVLNSLQTIADLAEEYDSSIGDPTVGAEDHREIAREIRASAKSSADWTGKAAAYLRSIKAHIREAETEVDRRFSVADAIDDARALVMHRLRAAGCDLLFRADAPIELAGDRGRLGQVLVNLIGNAVDAYEDRGIGDGRIEIHAAANPAGGVTLRVRDQAGGIPASVLPHIFDELYTTKGAGRGTGLGLWISRNLIEECFGGTLDVVTGHGGSCFVAEIPDRAAADAAEAPPRRPHETGPAPAGPEDPMNVSLEPR